MSATYVIGDIHGALKALQQVMAQLAPAAGDQLIFLGDYVNGWSGSAGVISYLMALQQQQSCIFIKGNHDEYGYRSCVQRAAFCDECGYKGSVAERFGAGAVSG